MPITANPASSFGSNPLASKRVVTVNFGAGSFCKRRFGTVHRFTDSIGNETAFSLNQPGLANNEDQLLSKLACHCHCSPRDDAANSSLVCGETRPVVVLTFGFPKPETGSPLPSRSL